jgi:hypothetical protein
LLEVLQDAASTATRTARLSLMRVCAKKLEIGMAPLSSKT